ncbi:MAG: glucose sorbosone dehydrogenase [Proteobacteria bacterium]|nr:MAG: glucose sorbosone dehydrogenase [Pseudomonadota bacterium]
MIPLFNFKIIPALILTLLLLRSGGSEAANFALTAKLSSKGRKVQFLVEPSESAQGCLYTLLASSSRGRLSGDSPRGILVLSASGAESSSIFEASRLPRLKSSSSKQLRLFFRLSADCDSSQSLSNLARVRFRNASEGRALTPRQIIKQIARKAQGGAFTASKAFPNISFSKPVDLQDAGDGSGRLFVAEQGGKIYVFVNNPQVQSKTLFLDISSLVETGGQEQGLLGLVFHPDYDSNGFFFVNYSKKGSGDTVISRFKVSTGNSNQADLNSETIILTFEQPFSNHNGGQLAFGPDGFLYIASGDGGSGGDPQGNGQKLTTLLGKILRIDVDSASGGENYAIPANNPFRGSTLGRREEIYAYGLRNPWRISFDPQTSRLWAADVGQSAKEEIDIIESGKNYGWNLMEGFSCYPPSATNCQNPELTLPIHDYPPAQGRSVTGGYVYRGSRLPALIGKYIYGDFVSGRIWAISYNGSQATNSELLDSDLLISSFGIDAAKELYLLSFTDGAIYRLSSG